MPGRRSDVDNKLSDLLDLLENSEAARAAQEAVVFEERHWQDRQHLMFHWLEKFNEVKLALLINSWNHAQSPPIICRLLLAQSKGDNYAIRAVVVRGEFA